MVSVHIQEHLKAITDRRAKARLKVKTFDAGATGPKPAGVLVAELHQMGKIKMPIRSPVAQSRGSRAAGQRNRITP
jgi:hypothetical protein